MALPAEFAEQQQHERAKPSTTGIVTPFPRHPYGVRWLQDQQLNLLAVFQENDPKEIALKQDEINCYISFQKGIPWDVPRRFHQHPDANRFHLHGDKKEQAKVMDIVGHAILDWQFDGGDKRIMRIASYARGHHPGYGALINNGLSEQRDGQNVGKETVMERTVYFNYPDDAPVVVNNFQTYNGFRIVDDRFITRYSDEIRDLLMKYSWAHYLKNKDEAVCARREVNTKGYDFEFFYGQPRVVVPGASRVYPLYGQKSYF